MKKQPDKGKITALYERLSHDDERAGESVSIENQKRILEDYAQKNGFTNIRHFTDDGVRGTTFKRPGLDAMLEEIRAGNVATVIIKDQSRIGRDVVEVGLLKRTFDEYHVRFIAANDNLDTANGFDIMSIFRDVINEWYVADTSRKIKTVFKSRMEKGLRCSGSVSYGYLASKENKGEWVIDEEAAAVVRRIFHSVVAGESIASIARALRAEKIPIPSEHWKRIGAPVRSAKYTDPYAWSTTTISYILKRPEYTGRKVLGKTVCENYKTKSTRKTAPEEQYIFDGEIPAIVDEETWNTVQRLMGTKRRAPKRQNTPNRLTGLLYCADCGAKLTHRSSLVQGKYLDDAFVCSSYRQLTRDCTMHYIPTAKMEAAILAAIQRVSWYVRHNEAEFIERVRKATDQHQENAVKEYRQKVSKAQRRYKELDGLVKKLYEGNATGKIPDKHFTRLLAEYDEEQTGLEAAIAQWQEAIESWNADRLKTDKFIELVSRYTDFSELTTPMLNEFIEKVVVHEGEGRGNSRRQRIDIYLNFIGAFEVPAHIVTPMEAEEQRRQQEEQAAKRHNAAPHAYKSLRLMKVFLKLLHQFRGQRTKIILAQSHNQKITGDNVINIAVIITQRTVQFFAYEFTFVVHHQCNRLIERISCLNIATYGFLQILQLTADLHSLRIHERLYQQHIHGICLFFLNLPFLGRAERNTGKVFGVQNVLRIVISGSNLFLCRIVRFCLHRNRFLQGFGDLHIVFFQVSIPPFLWK